MASLVAFDAYNSLKADCMQYIYALYPPINSKQDEGGYVWYQHEFLYFGNSAKKTSSTIELAEDLQHLFYMNSFVDVEEYKPFIITTLGFKSPTMNIDTLKTKLVALKKQLVQSLYIIGMQT